MPFSELTQAILPVLELLSSGPISEVMARTVEEIVAGEGLDGPPPAWMREWFRRIAVGQVSDELFRIPTGYPTGENGLINVLMEIEDEVMPLGFDDYGEGFHWDIPANGLTVIIIRECGDERCECGAMRPTESDINAWLTGEYRRLRAGGRLAVLG